jgi:hypothetical protein
VTINLAGMSFDSTISAPQSAVADLAAQGKLRHQR